jgi:hypothetical protein
MDKINNNINQITENTILQLYKEIKTNNFLKFDDTFLLLNSNLWTIYYTLLSQPTNKQTFSLTSYLFNQSKIKDIIYDLLADSIYSYSLFNSGKNKYHINITPFFIGLVFHSICSLQDVFSLNVEKIEEGLREIDILFPLIENASFYKTIQNNLNYYYPLLFSPTGIHFKVNKLNVTLPCIPKNSGNIVSSVKYNLYNKILNNSPETFKQVRKKLNKLTLSSEFILSFPDFNTEKYITILDNNITLIEKDIAPLIKINKNTGELNFTPLFYNENFELADYLNVITYGSFIDVSSSPNPIPLFFSTLYLKTLIKYGLNNVSIDILEYNINYISDLLKLINSNYEVSD